MLASLLPLRYNVDSCARTLQKDLSWGERRFAGKGIVFNGLQGLDQF
jgi:hypothetical protein